MRENEKNESFIGGIVKDSSSMTACFENYRNIVLIFVISMPINCVILEIEWFNEPLKSNEFEYKLSLVYLCFVFTMCMISYYYSVTIQSKPQKKTLPEQRNNFYVIPTGFKTNEMCEKGQCKNNWKPIRTHHCKVCDSCTLRMDHHCPWTVSCIGVNSHKSFYLTSIYWAMGGTQYIYRSYYFYYYLDSSNMTLSLWFYIYWAYTTIIVFFITCMLVLLVYYHTLLAMSNATSIEDRKGVKLCFGILDTLLMGKERYFNMNFFDEGVITNYTKFLDNSYFFFWWPHKVIIPYDGEMYSIIPSVTTGELYKIKGYSNDSTSKENYLTKLNEKNKVMEQEADEIAYKDRKIKFFEFNFP